MSYSNFLFRKNNKNVRCIPFPKTQKSKLSAKSLVHTSPQLAQSYFNY